MIQIQFLLQDVHFALNVFVALVMFSVAWLYFDAWVIHKKLPNGLLIIGYFLLSISFLLHATTVEAAVFANPFTGPISLDSAAMALKASGFIILIIGVLLDPLQKKPQYPQATNANAIAFLMPWTGSIIGISAYFLPSLCLSVAIVYLRRATIGMERHVKIVSLAFFTFAVSELCSSAHIFRQSNNIFLSRFLAPFGPLWIVEHVLLLAGALLLAKWVFQYLLKRIQSQLFMYITSLIVGIFLISTVSFSMVILYNLQQDTVAHLRTDVHILQYAITSKENETMSDAQLIAQNPDVQNAVGQNDTKKLRTLTTAMLLAKKQDVLFIVSAEGKVLMRGDDPDRKGDSLSDDPLVKRVLMNKPVSSVIIKDGVSAPEVSLRSASPIKAGERMLGAVIVGVKIDNAFLDGVKHATGLDASVYAGNIRSATTFVASDGETRWVGIKEETPLVRQTVLIRGEAYAGPVAILNIPYAAAYLPLEDMDNNPVGMLFVGTPQADVLQTVALSIAFTFLISIILLMLSIVPAFVISRSIANQLH